MKHTPRRVGPSHVVQVKCWDPAGRKPLPLYRCYGQGVGHHTKGVKCVAVFAAAGPAGGKISASGGEDNVVRAREIYRPASCVCAWVRVRSFVSQRVRPLPCLTFEGGLSFSLLKVRCWDPGGLGVPAGGTVVSAPARLPVPEADLSPSASALAVKKAERAATPLQKGRTGLDEEGGRRRNAPAAFTLPPVAKAAASAKRG